MSVDNISQVDELVPSRYAVQVGDIEVLVISDGVLPITASTLATNAATAELGGWLDDMFLPRDVVDWPLNVVVVRTGGRTILVDAGLGVEFPDFPRAGQTVHRLEAAGIDPGSVTDVVLTHLHMDHIGGLLTDGLKARLRPDLRVHLASAEAEFWEKPDFSQTVMPQPIPDVLAADRHPVPERVPRPTAAVRDRVRGGAGSAHQPHRRPHSRAQHRPAGVSR